MYLCRATTVKGNKIVFKIGADLDFSIIGGKTRKTKTDRIEHSRCCYFLDLCDSIYDIKNAKYIKQYKQTVPTKEDILHSQLLPLRSAIYKILNYPNEITHVQNQLRFIDQCCTGVYYC